MPLLVGGSLILGILIVVFISLLLFAPGVVSKFFPTIGASPTPVSVVTNDVARTDGRIMFIRRSTDGKNRDIFVVNADGSDQEQVTSGIFIEGTAAWVSRRTAYHSPGKHEQRIDDCALCRRPR